MKKKMPMNMHAWTRTGKSKDDSAAKRRKRPLSELRSDNEEKEEDQALPKAKRMKFEEVESVKVEKNGILTTKESNDPTKSSDPSNENDNANKDTTKKKMQI
ncbi:hypothetical protein RFI_17896 [Reticulomyxa filosa]|uniref:Uncharacterized protein n=1 Tax=Reticulomyxa filosa TaxID=46433 RepID=X6N0B5_RETFI|nr:hypothetical protein RFI_17896 [Reticulomyxa filosa]|eukprot:ETO19333.1 hypothetical protein RFI_17896 [Reticulomyxa filosa]